MSFCDARRGRASTGVTLHRLRRSLRLQLGAGPVVVAQPPVRSLDELVLSAVS